MRETDHSDMERDLNLPVAERVSRTTISTGTQTLSSREVTPASTNTPSQVSIPDTAEAKSVETNEKLELELERQRQTSKKFKKRSRRSGNNIPSDDDVSNDPESIESSVSEEELSQKKSKKRQASMYYAKERKVSKSKAKQGLTPVDSDSGSDSGTEADLAANHDHPRRTKLKKSPKGDLKPRRTSKVERSDASSTSDSDSDCAGSKQTIRGGKLRNLGISVNRDDQSKNDSTSPADHSLEPDAPFGCMSRVRLPWESLRSRGVHLSKKLAAKARGTKNPTHTCDDETRKSKGCSPDKSTLTGSKMEFIRVDQRWEDYSWVTRPTGQDAEAAEYDEYAFKVKREFDFDGKFQHKVLEIANKPLQKALMKVLEKVKCVSLVGEKPSIDPDILFMYSEELQVFKKQLKLDLQLEKKKSRAKKLKAQVKALRLLLQYLEKDYGDHKRKLDPMLNSGTIKFSLLWALYKPGAIIYASTYDTEQVPRAFKLDYAYRMKSILRGDYYAIEGQYIDYDGTNFGQASIEMTVDHFQGPRKITSLPCYPIEYHKDHENLRQELIRRGKVFASLKGMQFKYHQGMAFHKKPKRVDLLNLDGRVMVDPENFRRINPNYFVSAVKNEDPDLLPETDTETQGSCGSEDDDAVCSDDQESPRIRKKVLRKSDKKGNLVVIEVEQNEKGNEIRNADDQFDQNNFKEGDYLVASPVVLGFSFAHKRWVEFDVVGIRDIQFNETAFDSLVLPESQKQVVRALVESHSKNTENIEDVIQGKGEGLVTVLHGPPGCGKTLTAEGIAELLKKPLYMVSIGELGTRGGDLERNFSEIIDIAHSWSAILLLDEADIFLEKRQPTDLSRNALVSIFLRLLEYFRGIVFLTTNRVVHFDEAFQSRIHVGLRYSELGLKARKEVWRLFLEKVCRLPLCAKSESDLTKASAKELCTKINGATLSMATCLKKSSGTGQQQRQEQGAQVAGDQGPSSMPTIRSTSTLSERFTEADIARLSSYNLNGREIKNCVRTAQSLASVSGEAMSMKHLIQVLKVGEAFAKDFGGGAWDEVSKIYV